MHPAVNTEQRHDQRQPAGYDSNVRKQRMSVKKKLQQGLQRCSVWDRTFVLFVKIARTLVLSALLYCPKILLMVEKLDDFRMRIRDDVTLHKLLQKHETPSAGRRINNVQIQPPHGQVLTHQCSTSTQHEHSRRSSNVGVHAASARV